EREAGRARAGAAGAQPTWLRSHVRHADGNQRDCNQLAAGEMAPELGCRLPCDTPNVGRLTATNSPAAVVARAGPAAAEAPAAPAAASRAQAGQPPTPSVVPPQELLLERE